jgi:hypothetical protein
MRDGGQADGGFERWVARATWAVGALVIASPFFAAWLSWRGGWLPTGDQATLTTLSYGTISSHPPLLGLHSAVGGGGSLFHPGPLQLWLLAIPLHLFAPSPVGALIGSAALSSINLAVVLIVVRRRGGWRWVALATLLLALMCSGARILSLAQPLNPFLSLVALAGYMAACWAVMAGDDWFWPLAVFLGSLTVQPEVAFAFTVATCAGAVVVVRTITWFRGRGMRRPGGRRRALRVGAVTLVVGLLSWSGPLWDQFFGSGNLWRLATKGDDLGRVMGPVWGFERMVDVLALPPSWIFPSLEFHWHRLAVGGSFNRPPLSDWERLTAVIFAAVFAWGLVHAFRSRDRVRATLGLLAMAALAGSFLTASFMRVDTFGLHPGAWRATGLFAWLFAGLSGFDLVRHVGATRLAGSFRLVRQLAPALSASLAALVTVTGLTLRSSLTVIGGTGVYAPVASFTAAARPYCRAHGAVVIGASDSFHFDEMTGLATMVLLDGCPVHLTAFRDQYPSVLFQPTGREAVALIVSGHAVAPRGYRRGAVFDPAHPPARYRRYSDDRGALQSTHPVYLYVRTR